MTLLAPPTTLAGTSRTPALLDHDLHRLAARVGSTPFFGYDRALVRDRVAAVRAALPPTVGLHYAVKANPMPALLCLLAGLVDGFDVASAGELHRALDTGVPAARIGFAGPGKSDAELAQAVAAGVVVELESAGELDRITLAGDRVGVTPRVAVRVNPDYLVRGAGLRMGGGPAAFGVDAEAVPALLAEIGRRSVELLGFHIFAGSQNLVAEGLLDALRQSVDLVLRLAESAPAPVRYLNLGGGFGLPYAERDRPLDLAAVGTGLATLVDGPLAARLPTAEVVLELGRYLVGPAGAYVTRVIDRKMSRGTTYLVVDGGLHHQLAAAGLLGQVVRRNYPLALVPCRPGAGTETVTVAGRLCTPLDILGTAVELPVAAVGDLVVVGMAGAYGRTASPADFLGHPPAAEILV